MSYGNQRFSRVVLDEEQAERALLNAVQGIFRLGIKVQYGDVELRLVGRNVIPMDGSGMFDTCARFPGNCTISLRKDMAYDRAVVTLAHELMHFWLYKRKKATRAREWMDPCVEEAVCELVGLAIAEDIPARRQIIDNQAWLVKWYTTQSSPQRVREALLLVQEVDDGRRPGSRNDTREARAFFVQDCLAQLTAMGL